MLSKHEKKEYPIKHKYYQNIKKITKSDYHEATYKCLWASRPALLGAHALSSKLVRGTLHHEGECERILSSQLWASH